MEVQQHHPRIVYWSDRDNCFIGLCPSMFFGGVHGSSEKRVRAQLERAIREWEVLEAKTAASKKRKYTTHARRYAAH